MDCIMNGSCCFDVSVPERKLRYSLVLKWAIVTFLVFVCFFSAVFCQAESFVGRVVEVIDGDSIVVSVQGQEKTIRLYGIDCPEYKQPFGAEAGDHTRRLVFGKKVSVQVIDTDRYNRLVGLVGVDGIQVNSDLLAKGLAWHYEQYCRASFCVDWKKLETEAQVTNMGLWAERNPTPPWEWRRQDRDESIVDLLAKIVGIFLRIIDLFKELLG